MDTPPALHVLSQLGAEQLALDESTEWIGYKGNKTLIDRGSQAGAMALLRAGRL